MTTTHSARSPSFISSARKALLDDSPHWPTLGKALAAVAIISTGTASIPTLIANDAKSRAEVVAARVSEIPTKSELGREIDRAAEVERARFETETARLQALNDRVEELADHNQELNEMLQRRVEALDARIAAIGIDHSAELYEYFRSARQGHPHAGHEGGADSDEDVLSDYALRLLTRDAGMTPTQAGAFIRRAFLNQRGPEAQRIMELASSARARNQGVIQP